VAGVVKDVAVAFGLVASPAAGAAVVGVTVFGVGMVADIVDYPFRLVADLLRGFPSRFSMKTCLRVLRLISKRIVDFKSI
jgi:hypothetical protein